MDDGADGIELDVRTTRDGEVVVMHDLDLTRVTAGTDARAVATLDRREFSRVELTGGLAPPMLADVLDWADAARALVNVELKHDAHDKAALVRGVARLLGGRPRIAERVLFSTFDPELLARVAAALPRIPRGLLVHDGQQLARTFVAPAVARFAGAMGLHPQRTLASPARVAEWRRQGLALHVWTVLDPREGLDLARLGIDGLIGDDPATLIAALDAEANAARPACY